MLGQPWFSIAVVTMAMVHNYTQHIMFKDKSLKSSIQEQKNTNTYIT